MHGESGTGQTQFGLDLAERAAPVAAHGVAVVALLADVELDDAVSAEFDLLARLSGLGASPPGLEGARGGAAVTGDGVAVVALLVAGDVAVPAHVRGVLHAWAAVAVDVRTRVARLGLARGAASVAGHGVAVVARLARVDLAVAADPDAHAR
jgi:hypothetical protein